MPPLSACVLLFVLNTALVTGQNWESPQHINRRQSLNLGSCGSPAIEFAAGLDGQQNPTFKPVNAVDFPHGAAPDISTITSFICNRLQSPCNAPQETLDACNKAQSSVSSLARDKAADAWNAAFGVSLDDTAQNSTTSSLQSSTAITSSTTSSTSSSTILQVTSDASSTSQLDISSAGPTALGSLNTQISLSTSNSDLVNSAAISSSPPTLSLPQQQQQQPEALTTPSTDVTGSSDQPTSTTSASLGEVTQAEESLEASLIDDGCTFQAVLVTVTLPVNASATAT